MTHTAAPQLEAPADTPAAEVEAAIRRVASKASEWAALPLSEKKMLMKKCLRLSRQHLRELAQAGCAARGCDTADPQRGHLVADATLLSGVTVAAWLRGGIKLLQSLERTGLPPAGHRATRRPDGTWRVDVSPAGLKEGLLNDGASCQLVVRGEPRQYNPLDEKPSVTGVLGAGNTEILNDIIDPLCRLNSVVVYKSNPVMALSNRVKAKILAPLVERGYVAFVFGGAEQGRLVVESELTDRILITGSHHTYDRIVWGGRDKKDESVEPVVSKAVLAELGSVNPYIVVPGISRWSAREVQAQAEALAAYKLMNSSHICASPQVLVTCRHWPQREEFLEAVRRTLADAPPAGCFYPGIDRSYQRHLEATGGKAVGGAPWAPIFQRDLAVPDARSGEAVPVAFGEEAFCPVLYEVAVDSSPDLPTFLEKAVDFSHRYCWGSLSCSMIVDDATRARHREDLDRALDGMRFGSIGVNVPPASVNVLPELSWGAYPGHDPRDVQSGIGQLGNFCCYAGVAKSILLGRFTNLLTFPLARSLREKHLARGRAKAIARAYTHMSLWNLCQVSARQLRLAPLKTVRCALKA